MFYKKWCLSKGLFFRLKKIYFKLQKRRKPLTPISRTQSTRSQSNRRPKRRMRVNGDGHSRNAGLPEENFELEDMPLPNLGNLGLQTDQELVKLYANQNYQATYQILKVVLTKLPLMSLALSFCNSRILIPCYIHIYSQRFSKEGLLPP